MSCFFGVTNSGFYPHPQEVTLFFEGFPYARHLSKIIPKALLDLIQIGADLRRELLSGAQCGDVWDIVETPTPRHWHMMISVTRGRCVSPGRGKLRDHKSGHSGHVMMMSWSLILVTGQGSCLVRPKPALDPDLSAACELCSLQWPGYKGTREKGEAFREL